MEALQNILSAFRFASPFLSLGAALVFLSLLFLVLRRRKAEEHSHLEFVGRERVSRKIWQTMFFAPAYLALISILVVIAGLQKIEEIKEPLVAKDIIVVLDTSGSMMVGFYPGDILPNEFEKTRLGVAEKFLREFFKKRQGDRIAVILYDSPRGYIARPFTDDQRQLQSIFNEKEIEGVYQSSDVLSTYALHRGTDTPSGLKLARDYFEKESKSKEKLIVLVTDLDDDRYEIPQALEETRKRGINIYTISIVAGDYLKRIESVKRLFKDEGIKFFYVEKKEELKAAFNFIDQMEKSEVEIKEIVSFKSMSWIFVISGLFFTAMFAILNEISKKIP